MHQTTATGAATLVFDSAAALTATIQQATAAAARRSYRCTYTPLDRDGWPVASESGVLPSVRVQAASAEQARIAAHAVVRCPICDVERLDDAN